MNINPTKILLVDDDEDDMLRFIQALKAIDPSIKFMYADDGVSALRLLNDRETPLPDYIFMDLNMHRMNGKECLAEIKKSSYLSHLPVIICTTSKRESDVIVTKELGASSFFTKPMKFEELIQVLRFILNEKPVAGEYLNCLIEVF
jgi:DNA-binding response OmpR family regulator